MDEANTPSLFWLGPQRGYLSDWVTQRWVEFTGKRVDLAEHPWLDAPVGKVTGIGKGFFEDFALRSGLDIRRGGECGLLTDFHVLAGEDFDPEGIRPEVVDFYEHTSAFDLEAWSEWCGPFRPFGRLLALLFSRRLQQLNVPLSPLDTSRGITSEILRLVDPVSGTVRATAWIRELVSSGNVLYTGSYSTCRVPGYSGPCIRVGFPLPNGNALVIMRPKAHPDGSLSVVSAGRSFGDPGFYFTIRTSGRSVVARYVRALRESIRVRAAPDGLVRGDHVLTFWGATFLRLHYRLQRRRRTDEVTAE